MSADETELAARFARLAAQQDSTHGPESALTQVSGVPAAAPPAQTSPGGLPQFDGFQTIERLGAGGMGEVYKLRDLKLDRFVAAKVIRSDSRTQARLADFLSEARSMALFKDRRIVQVFEFRADANPPVIVMEHVEGFELGRLGPSLEFSQRARIVREVCDAIHHAHGLGIQHRDLKPSNIMLDQSLSPKILDFGLSGGDSSTGHFRGTLSFLAPEQLDLSQPIDARTDVYALGIILYELLAGVVPYTGPTTESVLNAIQKAAPRLPVEINPRIPEQLQAIALKAMERRPIDRYQSAQEMALDLTRHLDGRPVLARPTQYASTLDARVAPHVEQIREWLSLKLIYPHEADRLHSEYRRLRVREDDWIASARALSYSQIALYFGAFLLLIGGLYYFAAYKMFENVKGVVRPFLVLGVPFLGLNIAGRYLYRTERRSVAVAFFLAGVSLLPLFLLILFGETKLWTVPENTPDQLFPDGSVSNRQLQVTVFIAAAWCGWLALRTKTSALSTVFTVLTFLLALTILADFGLTTWIQENRADKVALHLSPLIAAYWLLGTTADRSGRHWLVRPLFVAAVITVVAVLDLLALEGRALQYLDISLERWRAEEGPYLETMCALAANGVFFYIAASALERWGGDSMKPAATLLFLIAPFSALEPVAYLAYSGFYSLKTDWLYLGLAVAAAILSHHRQRKSFYYAGLLNTGYALMLIANHRDWFKLPLWAMVLVGAGLVTLLIGFQLDARERRRAS